MEKTNGSTSKATAPAASSPSTAPPPRPEEPAYIVYMRMTVFAVVMTATAFSIVMIQLPSFILLLHSHKLYRWYIRLTEQIFGSVVVVTTGLFCPATKLVLTGDFDLIKPKHRSILFANHQIYPDWFYLWVLAWLRGCHGDLKILLMEWLAYLPFFGAGMWFFEFVFLKRKWANDKENMKKHLLKANDATEPLMLLIFPEGTLNTPHNKDSSRNFAKKNDITDHPDHCLLPKATGLYFCADTLKSTIDDVFDVTMGYSGLKADQVPYDEYLVDKVFFKNQYPREIHFHVDALKLKTIPGFTPELIAKDEDARKESFNLWLREKFYKKDKRLDRFFKSGSLVLEEEEMKNIPRLAIRITPELQDYVVILFAWYFAFKAVPVYWSILAFVLHLAFLPVLLLLGNNNSDNDCVMAKKKPGTGSQKGGKGRPQSSTSRSTEKADEDWLPPGTTTKQKPKDSIGGKGRKGIKNDGGGDWDDEVTKQLDKQLENLGLKLKDMTGDGNCLFRSLSDQIEGNPSNYAYHRASVCKHMEENRELYEPFMFDETLDQHIIRMKRDASYGENMEVVAFARANKVDIAIHQSGLPVWIINGTDTPPASRLLHIIYHSWEHYSSVRMINDTTLPGSPPSIQIQPQTGARLVAPLFAGKDLKTAPPTSMERMIMGTTGTVDLARVRELLVKVRGDPNKVMAMLFDEMEEGSVGVVEENDDGAENERKECKESKKEDVDASAEEESENKAQIDEQPDAASPPTISPAPRKGNPKGTHTPEAQTNPIKVKKVTARDKKEASRRQRKENALAKKRGGVVPSKEEEKKPGPMGSGLISGMNAISI
ncbi:hypothetical protein HDU67_007748 [Dinochytrium kinnereticum]|nr:hypothetical protein HDU67_007748 [Dinochytrium kinnereticum]